VPDDALGALFGAPHIAVISTVSADKFLADIGIAN
jgi:hypothetical protein